VMLKVAQVLGQKQSGEIASEDDYAAWLAFSVQGYPVRFYTWEELQAGRCALTRETLLVGGVRSVHEAFRQLGVPLPRVMDLPDSLAPYCGRRVWTTDWGTIHREFLRGRTEPVFVKPLDVAKAFVGYVLSTKADLEPTMRFPAPMKLLASEVVNFLAEWRFYVLRHEVLGVGHYAGDAFHYPDPEVVRSAVRDFALEAPVAYGIDFGVTDEGRTLLVEVNDAYALGSYGLSPPKYAAMLEARWLEIVGTPP
jgi:hypothetical protein